MTEPLPQILILCTDLIFSTKITGTAKSLGKPFTVIRTQEKLQAALDASPAALLIIDLNATGIDPIAAIRTAKSHSTPPRIVAFLSHVQVDLAKEAKAFGADQVLPRSAFTTQLPSILAGA